MLIPIEENPSFDDQSQVKRRKIDDNTPETNSTKEEIYLSTIDDIEEDDFKF